MRQILRAALVALLPTLTGGCASARSSTAPAATTVEYPFAVTRGGSGPAMILIPGLLSSGDVWNGTLAHFRSRYDVHVLTLAGFAGVPAIVSTPFLTAERDAIIRYIREKRLDRPVIVGHSLGGFLAFSIASQAPDLVGPIVSIDGVPFISALGDSTARPDTMSAAAARISSFYATLNAQQLGVQTRMGLPSMMRDSANIAIAAKWAGDSDPATAGRAIAEMLTTDLRAAVSQIHTPVLLIGAFGLVPEGQMRDGARRTYEAQVARIPRHRVAFALKARHFVMFDDPDWLFSTMDSFLAGSSSR